MLGAFVQKKKLFFHKEPGAPAKREQRQETTERFTAAVQPDPASSQMGFSGGGSRAARTLPAISDEAAMAFLRRFSNVAVGEHKKYGVPASVLLACSYVNSAAGQRLTAQQANNFFAMPCSPMWQGRTASLEGHCYRHYERAWDSFRDFSLYLHEQQWVADARQSAGSDWRKWAAVLASHEVSDVANFEAELRKVVEAYRLFDLDGQKR
ncbi:MAG TPA: glucosaminidase domain-containing protein [Saprospiraceae bacterium]|nr:glucosaminidase domain-containing protein [Saprospiraceae bacterium]HND88756.1 glucosaminidase domain-containing protein [Saprospiraceae bacterium]